MGADIRTSSLTPAAGQGLRGFLRRRFPQAASWIHFARTLPLRCRSAEAIFTSIHRRNAWRGGETTSGPGSGREATAALRRELLRLLNAERAAAGAPPLRRSPALDRAAQQHADEIAARGSLRGERASEQAMERRLRAAGYDAHQWAENLMSGPASAEKMVAAWRGDDRDGTFRRLLEPVYTDLGVGLARLGGAPLYAILFALPQAEAFARGRRP